MDPVEEQLEAYNGRDLERFLACYSRDVVIEDGAGNVTLRGHDAFRQRYQRSFAQFPEQRCRVVNRIRIGEYVIDEEKITGWGRGEVHVVAIYRVVGQQIVHVRFLDEPQRSRLRFWRRS